MTLLERYTTTVELTTYDEIREALFSPDLSRTFDRRSYEEGNIRDGIVSIQHGPVHRARRRVENSQFRPATLRLYEQKGLLRPKRTAGNTRVYSNADVERLQLIQKLTTDLGLNLAGVELVLRLEDELKKAHARIDRLQRQLRDEVQKVHKQYRRDLVLYRGERTPERR